MMDIKRDILWRVYLVFILVMLVCVFIFGKAFYIQQVEGAYWKKLGTELHQESEIIEAQRGTIYSEGGEMLSTSIPQFDVFIDFRAKGLRENNGKRFRENIDSLTNGLAKLWPELAPSDYKRILQAAYKKSDPYFELRKKISYREYQQLMEMPLVKLGRNKSGFIPENRSIRLNPYQMLAFRTIGLARDSFKVGLEMTYDSVLRGRNGQRQIRKIAGGVGVPVDEALQIEPENGKDLVTTIDVFIQAVAENALMNMMVKNEAENGCAIVMETKTGKIKAIANLGRNAETGKYFENFNYAINATEPGSTFKLATMMALLEDKKVDLNQQINLEGGKWQIADRTVYDSEEHGRSNVTIQQAFELSSNVGMAKLMSMYYGNTPSQFIRQLSKMRMDSITGIDLRGEKNALIYKPGNRNWTGTTLPWMSFGYNLTATPLQILTLYNAVANNGRMMKPYLVNAIKEEGVTIKNISPFVLREKICSDNTLKKLKACLEGVCSAETGTAKSVFKNLPYTVAGKTGTSLVADGKVTYADKVYQTSFAGYFPADNPQYTCIVVIRNKPGALLYYGATVAAPVFKEIADRLYTTRVKNRATTPKLNVKADSSYFNWVGNKTDLFELMQSLQLKYTDSTAKADEYTNITSAYAKTIAGKRIVGLNTMPQLKGMGLKDAVYLCENLGLKTIIKGRGRVLNQSLIVGQKIAKGQVINIQLN
jgi:cell division protein FtsI (penicillin-binding protein 3)